MKQSAPRKIKPGKSNRNNSNGPRSLKTSQKALKVVKRFPKFFLWLITRGIVFFLLKAVGSLLIFNSWIIQNNSLVKLNSKQQDLQYNYSQEQHHNILIGVFQSQLLMMETQPFIVSDETINPESVDSGIRDAFLRHRRVRDSVRSWLQVNFILAIKAQRDILATEMSSSNIDSIKSKGIYLTYIKTTDPHNEKKYFEENMTDSLDAYTIQMSKYNSDSLNYYRRLTDIEVFNVINSLKTDTHGYYSNYWYGTIILALGFFFQFLSKEKRIAKWTSDAYSR